jgi:hypothetical protein
MKKTGVIYQDLLTIPLVEGQTEYDLINVTGYDKREIVAFQAYCGYNLGIDLNTGNTNAPSALYDNAPRCANGKNKQINEQAFYSAYLRLQHKETVVSRDLPMRSILFASLRGRKFKRSITDINPNQSKIYISEPRFIRPGEAIELVVYFRYI